MKKPHRCTVNIDGTKFGAITTSVQLTTDKDHAGCPQMGSLSTMIRVCEDFHDDTNLPFATIKKMFDLANVVTKEKIRPITIEFWRDDSKPGNQDALCSYKFNGWIRRFETTNPIELTGLDQEMEGWFRSLPPEVNHVLVLDLEPAMNKTNFREVRMSK
jgi:hypothetical protein